MTTHCETTELHTSAVTCKLPQRAKYLQRVTRVITSRTLDCKPQDTTKGERPSERHKYQFVRLELGTADSANRLVVIDDDDDDDHQIPTNTQEALSIKISNKNFFL
jgi:hypothetical protein